MAVSTSLLKQFDRMRDAQRSTFMYLKTAEREYLFDLYTKDKKNDLDVLSVIVYDLELKEWFHLDRTGGMTSISGGAGGVVDHNDLTAIQGGVPTERYHLTQSQLNKLQEGNYRGDWDASANIPAIPAPSMDVKDHFYRVTVAGNFSINAIAEWEVGDLIWCTGIEWVKLHTSEPYIAKKTTILQITGTIPANTPISIVLNGANSILSGDSGNLGSSNSFFLEKEHIAIYRNGAFQTKGIMVFYHSSTEIKLNNDLRAGESIVVLT